VKGDVAGKHLRPRDKLVRQAVDLGRLFEAVRSGRAEEFRVVVRRPDDLLVFDIVFENLRLAGKTPERLIRTAPDAPAYFTVEFPPQSFGEQAYLDVAAPAETSDKEVSKAPGYPPKNVPSPKQPLPPQLPAARIRMAGPSRVVVSMPAEVTELPYTLGDVLTALRTWPMRLDLNAAPDPELDLDRAWLRRVTSGAGWRAATATLIGAMEQRGIVQAERPLAQAARRVGSFAAEELAAGRRRGLANRLNDAMAAELDALGERFPQLREGIGRETGLAALALGAGRAVAGSSHSFELDASLIGRIPIFLIPLAPHAPGRNVTALELPYRLVLSPIESARWRHSEIPVERHGRTELWHTRLTTTEGIKGPDAPSKVRAIWSPDYPIDLPSILNLLQPPEPKPYRMSLDPLDRQMLVTLMAGFDATIDGRRSFTPRSSAANRLFLSSLGGLLDTEGNWNSRPKGVDLEQWRHEASLGRDHYVRVVYAGFLCPFGHAASLIKVTERKFESLSGDPSSERVAVLRQRFFIIVREPVKTYDGANHVHDGNTFPFTSVEILSRTTPNLAPPGDGQSKLVEAGSSIYDVVPRRGAFWPMVPGGDFRFDMAAVDLAGNRVTFAMPLLFVGDTANDQRMDAVRKAYDDGGTATRRRAELGGSTVCFAPAVKDEPDPKGDPRLPAASITFDAGDVKSRSRFHANFYPEIETAEVGIRAVQRLLGRPNAIAQVRYPDVFRDHAFDVAANKGEVFLQTIADYALEFGGNPNQAKSDALGALASPAMAIQGLSRIMGPAADLGAVTADTFDPANFFKDATILGGIPLASLLTTITGLASADVPKMLSRELPAGSGLPQRVEARFDWQTELKKSDPLGLLIPRADPARTSTLAMSGVMTTPVDDPASASYEAVATVDNFKLNLFGFITIWFDLLRFDAKRGQKPDVAVDIHPGDQAIVFGGPLEFVNTLRTLIPAGGFSDPPGISVTPSGITASYSLNLPAIEVGIFALSNASLGAGFAVPFDSRPANVRFNFSEREHPFSLTVSLLGGGGFFAIAISSKGVDEIEAALEFGAAVAINLGVASGGVEIKAGVYFHWLEPVPNKGSVELAGYVRLHGELSVLGIISASLTFNLQIAYLKDTGAHTSIVWGEATLVVEIEVLFFSASVSVKCRREFAGSASDPSFVQLVPSQTVWNQYCDAFAEEAA
jgi:hypothetical protein